MKHTSEFVVVGLDGSEAADEAAKWAADEAARRHCELRLVHAYSLPANAGYPGYNAYPDDLRPVLQDVGRRLVNRVTDDLQRTHPGLAISSKVLRLAEVLDDPTP